MVGDHCRAMRRRLLQPPSPTGHSSRLIIIASWWAFAWLCGASLVAYLLVCFLRSLLGSRR
jgi:hypothetical protein